MDTYIKIQLNGKNGSHLSTLIDKEDFELVSKYRWWCLPNGNGEIYAKSYFINPETKKRKYILLHRLITRALPHEIIDHINHKTLDNRKNNLRICSAQQSVGNITQHKNNTSGFKGVSVHKNKKTGFSSWRARINFNRKEYVTYHKNIEEAIKSYDTMAKKFYGEFAFTNEDIIKFS